MCKHKRVTVVTRKYLSSIGMQCLIMIVEGFDVCRNCTQVFGGLSDTIFVDAPELIIHLHLCLADNRKTKR